MAIELVQCAAYAVLQQFSHVVFGAIGRSLLGINVDPPSVNMGVDYDAPIEIVHLLSLDTCYLNALV